MNLKWVSIGTALLAVVAIVGYVALRSDNGAPRGREGTPLLAGVDLAQAARIVISKGQGKVTLTNSPQGWLVHEAADFPADQTKIKRFLFQLVEDKLGFRVTTKPDKLAELGLNIAGEPVPDEPYEAIGFAAYDAQAQPLYALLLGKPRPPGESTGRGGRYVRVQNEPAAYLVSSSIALDAKPEEWLAHELLQVDKALFKAIHIVPSSGPSIELSRPDKDSAWGLAGGGQVNPTALEELLRQSAKLDFAKLGDPSATPAAHGRAKLTRVTQELFDGRSYRLTIGETKLEQDGNNFATAEAALDNAVTDESLRKTVDDFNQRFKNRVLAVYDFDVKPFLTARKEYLKAK